MRRTISYQDAQFELFGVPFYTCPTSSTLIRRSSGQSGFLSPSYGSSSTLGFGVEVPYYFALAPNYDFTFHPQCIGPSRACSGRAISGTGSPTASTM